MVHYHPKKILLCIHKLFPLILWTGIIAHKYDGPLVDNCTYFGHNTAAQSEGHINNKYEKRMWTIKMDIITKTRCRSQI